MIAAFAGSYFYAASKGIEEHTIVKWMSILLAAVFVFGYAVKKFWDFRRKWTFWAGLGVSLLVTLHYSHVFVGSKPAIFGLSLLLAYQS
jgi:hypothetical protein